MAASASVDGGGHVLSIKAAVEGDIPCVGTLITVSKSW